MILFVKFGFGAKKDCADAELGILHGERGAGFGLGYGIFIDSEMDENTQA